MTDFNKLATNLALALEGNTTRPQRIARIEAELRAVAEQRCPKHKTVEEAAADECLACGELHCEWGEPLHYHHDGCPSAYVFEKKAEQRGFGACQAAAEQGIRAASGPTVGLRCDEEGNTSEYHPTYEPMAGRYVEVIRSLKRGDHSPLLRRELEAELRGLRLDHRCIHHPGYEASCCERGERIAELKRQFDAMKGAGTDA